MMVPKPRSSVARKNLEPEMIIPKVDNLVLSPIQTPRPRKDSIYSVRSSRPNSSRSEKGAKKPPVQFETNLSKTNVSNALRSIATRNSLALAVDRADIGICDFLTLGVAGNKLNETRDERPLSSRPTSATKLSNKCKYIKKNK